jgi:hypothetical protein
MGAFSRVPRRRDAAGPAAETAAFHGIAKPGKRLGCMSERWRPAGWPGGVSPARLSRKSQFVHVIQSEVVVWV